MTEAADIRAMIEAIGIEKSYGTLQVLKGVQFSAQAGELVSIMGDSGAGKTTFLQILGTLEEADKGSIQLKGVDLLQLSPRKQSQFRNRHIGFVFQFHHLLPEFTAFENICMPGYIAKRKRSEVEAEAHQLIDRLGLRDRAEHKPNAMSGGEQQRVAVARALINKPALVLADEPTGNLDTRNAAELHNLFLELRTEYNSTFVVITHNPELAKLADRRYFMRDGLLSLTDEHL